MSDAKMSEISAVELQRNHENTVLVTSESSSEDVRLAAPSGGINTESHEAFPSLAPSPSVQGTGRPATSAWSSAGPRIRPSVAKQPMLSDSFTLSLADISAAGKDGKTGVVIRQVIAEYKDKVKIEASTNNKARQTTFYLKSESQGLIDKAKRSLLVELSPIVSLVLQAPVSTIPIIIGSKGATLNKVREQTKVKVDIPRREQLQVSNGNGTAHSPSGASSPLSAGDEEEEPTLPITITGPQPLAVEAQEMLKGIIATKRSRATQRVRDIPAHVLPFLLPRRSVFESAAGSGDVQLSLNQAAWEITVSGDREAVGHVIDSIRSATDYFTKETTSLRLTLPRRQHRLLMGKGADEIMMQSKCAVILPKPEESSEEIVVWGKATDLSKGVEAVMAKANSAYIHEFPLPGPIAVSRQLLTYITHAEYPKKLSEANPGVSVYTPPLASIDKASVLNVDIIGEKPAVDATVSEFSKLIGKLIGATKDVPIDWLVHRIVNSNKNSKKFKAFHETNNVLVFFPPESAEQSSVLLVYDPESPSASPSPVEKSKNLEDVETELLKMAKDAADVKTEKIPVDKKWHEAVLGQNGTTLNAIIGEDKTLSIKVGAEVGDDTENVILIRGASSDVDRAVKEILQIVEDAKNDEIVSSYSTEFDIDKEYVGRVVGTQGTGVNRLRDTLGVKIDFSDDMEDKDTVVGKKKKSVPQKSHVKIVGRKENVEEAKKRILAHVERLADETSEVLKIPHEYHAGLIGQFGKYVTRLEEKYGVKITFPRGSGEDGEGKTRESLKHDEVLVKGGRKGVAQAKTELLDAVAYEKDNNQVLKFTVPTRAVARILGKSGVTINEIKDITGAQIDVDKSTDEKVTDITIHGNKNAIAEAKARILEISEQVAEETTDTVEIESKFHRTIIGAGGQGLKELIIRCGGPSDSKAQAGLVRFPRQGETFDEVRLRGEPKLVAKLKAELEKTAATLRDRVVLGVEVPASQHRALIGRGGQHLNDLQNRTGVQVQFPGSRSYHQIGEPENAADLASVEPADIVKVSGPRAACERALEELKKQVKPAAPELVTATVTIPLKYHHAVTQQGNFFRNLKSSGVQVEQSKLPQKPAVPPHPASKAEASEARIDDTGDVSVSEVDWQVMPNYQDTEEGDSEWTFKARDQASLDHALKLTQEAIEHAEKMSHIGFLTLPDRSSFPRIVGAKGANVTRLRNESGADITVSREDSTVVIVGSEAAIEKAKEAILKVVNNSNGRPRGGRRDA